MDHSCQIWPSGFRGDVNVKSSIYICSVGPQTKKMKIIGPMSYRHRSPDEDHWANELDTGHLIKIIGLMS
jgi:hypothetical protein